MHGLAKARGMPHHLAPPAQLPLKPSRLHQLHLIPRKNLPFVPSSLLRDPRPQRLVVLELLRDIHVPVFVPKRNKLAVAFVPASVQPPREVQRLQHRQLVLRKLPLSALHALHRYPGPQRVHRNAAPFRRLVLLRGIVDPELLRDVAVPVRRLEAAELSDAVIPVCVQLPREPDLVEFLDTRSTQLPLAILHSLHRDPDAQAPVGSQLRR
mmetsp:Transcript_36417/g.86183  ORF Transcript_36417/g.86183 Transcript_36417/m.86183 type:complete len:210 (+) Transcript_36417:298-927(+)